MKILLLLACLSLNAFAEQAGTGLQISAAGDIVGEFGTGAKGKLAPREGEVLLFAPIDQTFDGQLSLAAHNESGEAVFEIHELFLSTSKLIPRSRIRVGQFFLTLGRLNQFHRHDWPFISAPKVHETFFASEAAIDSGAEYSWLLPVPFYLDITFGVTNGWTFGHSHVEGTKPLAPVHYIHAVTYNDLFWQGGMQTGLTYLARNTFDSEMMRMVGLDHTAKWREGPNLKFLLQSEVWWRQLTRTQTSSELGFYIYPQYGISMNWQIGVRLDGFTILSLKDVANNKVGNFDYGIVPTLSYKASEFSTLRLAYNHKGHLESGSETSRVRSLELQGVFILGTHPAHDF